MAEAETVGSDALETVEQVENWLQAELAELAERLKLEPSASSVEERFNA